MAYYKGQVKVPTDSYNAFRAATVNNAYDVDYTYGAQCYDMGNVFWLNACGRWVTSATRDGGVQGGASGIWGDRANNNRGNEFELITDYNKLKRGDIVITNNGQYGHICWLDADNTGQTYLPVFGQNQGGTSGGVPGAECNVINWNLRGVFLGAFRYKKWNSTPTPTPTPSGNTYTVVSGDTLSGIGSKLGIDWHTIANLNGIVSPYIIYPGQVLRLPGNTPAPTPQPTNPFPGVSDEELARRVWTGEFGNGDDRKKALGNRYEAVQSLVDKGVGKPTPSYRTHTVQRGESLSYIARQYNTTWQKIYNDNKSVIGSNPNLIYVGQKLIIK